MLGLSVPTVRSSVAAGVLDVRRPSRTGSDDTGLAQPHRPAADLYSMRISGSTAAPLPTVNPTGRTTGRAATPAADTTPATAPVEVPATPEPGAGEKAHGLVKAAGHSHRSDVAALRQWINHPELRADLALPDLTAEHHGNGFQQAVAAYEAATAIGTPVPVADPAPVPDVPLVVTDPAPVEDPGVLADPGSHRSR